MALLDGGNAPAIKVYLDATNRNTGVFVLDYSLLDSADKLTSGPYTPFSTLIQLPSADIRSVSIRRGRTREDQNFQAGQLTLVMDNLKGDYDPQMNVSAYQGSDGKSIICGNTGVRVTATYYGTEYVIYSGYIEQVDLVDDMSPTVQITCVDALAVLARQTISFNPADSDNTDADVVGSVLTRVGWPSAFRSIGSALYSIAPSMNVSDTALAICTNVAQMQKGVFFASRLGQPVFLNYSDANNPASVKLIFSDQRPTANTTDIEYDSITISGGEKYLVNSITINNTSGDVISVNSASVSRYGAIIKSLPGYFANSANAKTMATNMATYWGTPNYRVEALGFDGYGLTDWSNILTAELSDQVLVRRQSAYKTTSKAYFSRIESLNHDITADSWRMSVNLSPVFY